MSDLFAHAQAAYATAHRLSHEAVGYQPYRVIVDWWRGQEIAKERERVDTAGGAAGAAEEDQDERDDDR